MRYLTAIAILLLIVYPAYGRESKHSKRSLAVLSAQLTASQKASETDGTDTDDQEMDTDDQETNDNDTETGDMDTDDQEMTDTNDNDENDDNDDMNGTTTTVKSAIQNAIKAMALKHSSKPFAGAAAALDAGLDAQQTISQLLEPPASGIAAAATTIAAGGGSAVGAAGSLASGTTAAATTPSANGNRSVASVPEPASWLIAALGALPWLWNRRRF
jgi:Tfp pilus assembly protein PilE